MLFIVYQQVIVTIAVDKNWVSLKIANNKAVFSNDVLVMPIPVYLRAL